MKEVNMVIRKLTVRLAKEVEYKIPPRALSFTKNTAPLEIQAGILRE